MLKMVYPTELKYFTHNRLKPFMDNNFYAP